MAILKSNEGIIINATNSISTNFGCRLCESTRLFPAVTSGISLIQFTQNGATSEQHPVSIAFTMAAIRTSVNRTELPAYFAGSLLFLNTNGTISKHNSGYSDRYAQGGNLTLDPSIYSGGSSFFLGANNNQSTGIVASVKATICTTAWNNLTVTLLSNP
jgi:hypothetical protein